jgi:hypothetical protein
MGNTYANVTLVGTTGPEVVAALAGSPAFVADAGDGCVVVFAEADELDGFSEGITASRLSTALGVPAFEVAVYDDDLLLYQLLAGGEVVDAAAVPDEIAEAMEMGGELPGPAPERLVAALGRGDADAAAAVLAGHPVFVSDLHAKLAAALGLPPWAAAHGWGYLDAGESEIPVDLVRT